MTENTSSAKSTLIDWANKQESWLRQVVADLLDDPSAPTEATLASYYTQLLVEKALCVGDALEAPPLVDSTTPNAAGQSFSLRTLTDIRGVNALATGQTIEFGPKATVLFGENGVGKTGYVRILKMVANGRKADNVVPDIAGQAPVPPHALIKFETDQGPDEVEWNGERGLGALSQMDVFDSRATQLHLDEELSFTYTPRDLALFGLVRGVVEEVKDRLRLAREEKLSQPGLVTSKFSSGTAVELAVSKLGVGTDVAGLKALATLSDAEQGGLVSLRQTVESLQANAASASLMEVARSDWEMFRKIQDCIAPFKQFDLTAYNDAAQKVATELAKHEQTTKAALAGENIPGILGKAWKNFIEAGQEYLDTDIPAHELKLGDPCIYCRQPLRDTGLALAVKYHAFCKASRKPLDDARKEIGLVQGECLSVDLPAAIVLMSKKMGQFNEGKVPAILDRSNKLLAVLLGVQATMKGESSIAELPVEIATVDALVVKHISDLNEQIRKLGQEGTERSTTLATEKKKLQELEDRASLAPVLVDAIKKVDASRWADSAKTVLSNLATVSNALTTTMKVASQALINSDFTTHFEAECAALGAPPVRLEFPGKDTVAARRKSLSDRYKLSEILSEGEQRVVALADFLAEAALRPRPTPIIFDDPVNSLDYLRLKHVAQRIAEISQVRQVVVFTHNIWFAIEVLDKLDKDATYFDVQSDEKGKGIVTPGTAPRTDSLGQLASKINVRLTEAAKLTGEKQLDSLEQVSAWMRSYCEVLAEKELLHGVSCRYEPNVHVDFLERIVGSKLDAAVKVVVPIYRELCRQISAHSQPIETLNIRPKLEDVKKQWADLQSAKAAYRSG